MMVINRTAKQNFQPWAGQKWGSYNKRAGSTICHVQVRSIQQDRCVSFLNQINKGAAPTSVLAWTETRQKRKWFWAMDFWIMQEITSLLQHQKNGLRVNDFCGWECNKTTLYMAVRFVPPQEIWVYNKNKLLKTREHRLQLASMKWSYTSSSLFTIIKINWTWTAELIKWGRKSQVRRRKTSCACWAATKSKLKRKTL